MIYLFSGTPGSGKSLHMAYQIYWNLKTKKHVICNFDINKDVFDDEIFQTYFHLVQNDEINPALFEDFTKQLDEPPKEGSIKVYIDEAQLLFNSREWMKKDRAAWVRFFSLHRKLGYDIYLVAQFDQMLDKQIRALIEYEIKHRKLNNFGFWGKFLSLFFLARPVLVNVKFWYPLKQRVGRDVMIARKKYYRLYDTTKIFDKA